VTSLKETLGQTLVSCTVGRHSLTDTQHKGVQYVITFLNSSLDVCACNTGDVEYPTRSHGEEVIINAQWGIPPSCDKYGIFPHHTTKFTILGISVSP